MSNFEDAPPPEFAKEEPEIWMIVLSYSSNDDNTIWQGVAKKFYYDFVPKHLERKTSNSIPRGIRDKYLFSEPKQLMKTVTITHILALGNERILVSFNGMKTCIYNHASNFKFPFRKNNWHEMVHLKEIDD